MLKYISNKLKVLLLFIIFVYTRLFHYYYYLDICGIQKVTVKKTLLEPLFFFLDCHLGQENSPGQPTRGSLQGDPCIIPGQNMGALPGSSVRGLGYRDTAAGLKYIPAVVAKPLIRGKPERICPAVVMGLPKISLIPCGVPSGI